MVEPVIKFFFPSQYKDFLKAKEQLSEEINAVNKMRDGVENTINQRVAQVLLQMDPFEPLFRTYKGAFSEVYEKPEDKLDETGRMKMMMLGYHLRSDPSFKFLIQWMLDTEGNNYIRKGHPTPQNLLFSRAMLTSPLLLRREIDRLGSAYDDWMSKNKPEEFDEDLTVE